MIDRIVEALRSERYDFVAFEGPNGAGKTTLGRRVSDATGIPLLTGPRPRGNARDPEVGREVQRESEWWLVSLFEVMNPRLRGRRGKRIPYLLDRGWTTIEVYRRMFGRPPAPDDYRALFCPFPPRSLVVFLDSEVPVSDVHLVRDDLIREREFWRQAVEGYTGDRVILSRNGGKYDAK